MITNPRAGQIRKAAQLRRKKERLATGRFLVEGPHAVSEALRFIPERVLLIYITLRARAEHPEIDRHAAQSQTEVVVATDEVLAELSDTVTPQGVIAVVQLLEQSLSAIPLSARLVAVLDQVRDPGNAGTVLRGADAAGVDAVIFSGDSIDPWHPKVVRATTGSLFHIPVIRERSLEKALRHLHARSFRTIAADLRGSELSPDDKRLLEPTAWVFGNEARGLSQEAAQLCAVAHKLPIFGEAESLNLAMAATVCLYTTAFAQRAGASRNLSD